MRAKDRACIFLHICPEKIFEIQVTDEIPEDAPQQDVPEWTAFHAVISNRPSVPTNTGYCQVIPSPLSDFNTVYTVLKRAEALFGRIGQEMITLTWDKALYSKAQIIKWRNANEFENLFNRMSGFIKLPITWEISELSWKEVGLKIAWLSRASTAMPLFLKSVEERHTTGE